jgi:hypothetical protein
LRAIRSIPAATKTNAALNLNNWHWLLCEPLRLPLRACGKNNQGIQVYFYHKEHNAGAKGTEDVCCGEGVRGFFVNLCGFLCGFCGKILAVMD